MTIIVKNLKKEFLPAFKALAKGADAKVESKKQKLTSMQKALKEYKNQEFESFKNFDEYKKAMRSV